MWKAFLELIEDDRQPGIDVTIVNEAGCQQRGRNESVPGNAHQHPPRIFRRGIPQKVHTCVNDHEYQQEQAGVGQGEPHHTQAAQDGPESIQLQGENAMHREKDRHDQPYQQQGSDKKHDLSKDRTEGIDNGYHQDHRQP